MLYREVTGSTLKICCYMANILHYNGYGPGQSIKWGHQHLDRCYYDLNSCESYSVTMNNEQRDKARFNSLCRKWSSCSFSRDGQTLLLLCSSKIDRNRVPESMQMPLHEYSGHKMVVHCKNHWHEGEPTFPTKVYSDRPIIGTSITNPIPRIIVRTCFRHHQSSGDIFSLPLNNKAFHQAFRFPLYLCIYNNIPRATHAT